MHAVAEWLVSGAFEAREEDAPWCYVSMEAAGEEDGLRGKSGDDAACGNEVAVNSGEAAAARQLR